MIWKMSNSDDITKKKKKNIKQHNPNWPQILDHLWRISINGCSGSGKIKSLFNLISEEPDIDKHLFVC